MLLGPAPVGATSAKPLIVVELFQSQGCSDCPPAQINLNRLADRPDLLALSFGVTYWDYLGWRDSFASPQFTQRQRDYSARNHDVGVATPQYWINGRQTVFGASAARVAQLVSQPAPPGPAVEISGGVVRIASGAAPRGGAEILLVRYDPRTIPVAIRAGENGGRTVPHRNIVREVRSIGHWRGMALSVPVPNATIPGLHAAILLQAGRGGPILAAAKG